MSLRDQRSHIGRSEVKMGNSYVSSSLRLTDVSESLPPPSPLLLARRLFPPLTAGGIIELTKAVWDRITSEESTLLVASYLSHPTHPEIHKSTLPVQFPLRSSIYSASPIGPPHSTPCFSSSPSDTPAANPSPATTASDHPYPAEPLPGSADRGVGTWVYEGDQNAATHLIRNSLGGGDRKGRNELLSLTGGVTRWLRDDITVTLVDRLFRLLYLHTYC